MRKVLIAFILFTFSQSIFAQTCPPSSDPGIHIVQKGQTYYRLSKIYNISIDQILAWNGRTLNDVLGVCDAIRIAPFGGGSSISTGTATTTTTPVNTTPATTAPATPSGRYSKPFNQYYKQEKGVHYVKEDENLKGLAQLYGYTAERFREFNGMVAGAEVITGQVLRTTDCACLNTITDSKDELVSSDTGASGTQGGNSTGSVSTTPSTSPPNTGSGNTGEVVTTDTNSGSTASTPKAKADYMKTDELLMLDEINLIRSNPVGYIPYVQEYISYLQKNGSFGNSIQTARELILELQKTPALSVLEPKECVYSSAKKHGEDEKRLGRSDHMGSDGSWPWDRILRECPSLQDGNENLVGGPADIRRAVMLLLVDDGIPNRGHRKTLLNPSWKYAACYKVGMIGSMPNSWVQNFAH